MTNVYTTIFETDKVKVTFKIKSDWGTGYDAEVEILNKTAVILKDWSLSFLFEYGVGNPWNARMASKIGDRYTIDAQNYSWNKDVAARGKVIFGFQGNPGDITQAPSDFVFQYLGSGGTPTPTPTPGASATPTPSSSPSPTVSPTPGVQSFANFIYTDDGTKITITGVVTRPIGDLIIPSFINDKPVAVIGNGAFYLCRNITSITIPASVVAIATNALEGCTKLSAINVNSGNPAYASVDGVLFNAAKDTLIYCPGSITGAFAVPAGVTGISAAAFSGCTGLTSVTVPSSVTSVGANSFFGCSNLKSVEFLGDAPSLGANAFGSVASGFTVYYHSGKSGFTSPTWNGYPSLNIDIFPTPTPAPTPIVFSDFAATYTGLIGQGDTTGTPAEFFKENGFIEVTTTTLGGFSGKLDLEGQSHSFKGQFGATGNVTVTILRKGKASIVLALKLPTTISGSIEGSVTTDGLPISFQAKCGIFSGQNVHPFNGNKYTVLLPDADAVLGIGYLTFSFKADGVVTVSGKLADGTVVTASCDSAEADDSSYWLVPLFDAIYKDSAGLLRGELLLPKIPVTAKPEVSEGSSGLGWLRPANAKEKLFPNGFLKTLQAVGTKYNLTKNVSLFSGNATAAGFEVSIDPLADVLPSPITQPATWPATNVPTLVSPVASSLKITLTSATGKIAGSFTRISDAGKTVKTGFEGVVLSYPLPLDVGAAAVRGGGFFTTETDSAPFELHDTP